MPMTNAAMKAVLQPAINAAVRSQYSIVENVGDVELAKFAEALAEGISNALVPYIQANAQVSGTTIVSSGSSAGTWPTTGTVT